MRVCLRVRIHQPKKPVFTASSRQTNTCFSIDGRTPQSVSYSVEIVVADQIENLNSRKEIIRNLISNIFVDEDVSLRLLRRTHLLFRKHAFTLIAYVKFLSRILSIKSPFLSRTICERVSERVEKMACLRVEFSLISVVLACAALRTDPVLLPTPSANRSSIYLTSTNHIIAR